MKKKILFVRKKFVSLKGERLALRKGERKIRKGKRESMVYFISSKGVEGTNVIFTIYHISLIFQKSIIKK